MLLTCLAASVTVLLATIPRHALGVDLHASADHGAPLPLHQLQRPEETSDSVESLTPKSSDGLPPQVRRLFQSDSLPSLQRQNVSNNLQPAFLTPELLLISPTGEFEGTFELSVLHFKHHGPCTAASSSIIRRARAFGPVCPALRQA